MVREVLWLAPTRPAMRWGVPSEGLLINMVGSFYFGMVMGSPLYWLVFPAMHMPMRVLASWDHSFFRVLRMWALTKAQGVGSSITGASTLSPLPHAETRVSSEYQVLV